MKKVNKNLLAIQMALKFVDEHREQFEEWARKRALDGNISHLDKVFGVDSSEES